MLRPASQGYGRHKSKPKHSKRFNNFIFDKSKGQHILKNPGKIREMISKAGLKPTDVVLEIGPGTGNLTMQILPLVKKVIAIELDMRMIAELKKRVHSTPFRNKLEVIAGDVIKTELPFFNVCIANTPYEISSPLLFKLLTHRPSFRCAVLMFQHEFSERCYAQPGSKLYCRLSVNCQLLAKVNHLMKVGRNNFKPPPKVDSSVIRLEPRHPPPPVNYLEWDGMIRIIFNRKNKGLRALFTTRTVIDLLEKNHNTLCAMQNKIPCDDVKETIIKILEKHNFLAVRPSKMDINQLLALLAAFNEHDFHFRS